MRRAVRPVRTSVELDNELERRMKDFYAQFHPKQRTGKECGKTECERHSDYVRWSPGTANLEFCMNCKHANISQFKRKVSAPNKI